MLRMLILVLSLNVMGCSGQSYTVFRKDAMPTMMQVIEVCNWEGSVLKCDSYFVCERKKND